MKQETVIVLKNTMIQENIYEMVLLTKQIASISHCGQFLHLSINDSSMLLRRPISISKIDQNQITICFRVEGEGTKLLSTKKEGDTLDILGPLGNGFPLVQSKKVLLVGGGIGVPPLLELAKQLKEKGNELQIVLGFKDEKAIIYENEFIQYGSLSLTLDSGTRGFHGNAIQFLEKNPLDFDVLYACGPMILLRKLDEKYQSIKEGYLSFEERMACGIGACYGCVCKTNNKNHPYQRICKEGPVFSLGEMQYETQC